MSIVKLKIRGKEVDTQARFNEGVWVPIKLDGEPIGLEFRMRSRHSDIGEKLAKEQQRKLRAQFQKHRRVEVQDPEELDRERLDYILALAIDWRGEAIADEQGNVPKFETSVVREFLQRESWMIPQLDSAAGDDSAFLLN